jgi:hypothetical protein
MIQRLIARWRQRKLVRRGLPLTGVVAPKTGGCCGGSCQCKGKK